MMCFTTICIEDSALLIGPMDEGTCSWPSVLTGTPSYGSLELWPNGQLGLGVLRAGQTDTWLESIQSSHVCRYAHTATDISSPAKQRAVFGYERTLAARGASGCELGIERMYRQSLQH